MFKGVKQYFKRYYKGFIVIEYTQDQLTNFKSENIILFNELIHGIGVQTPPEICLLKGYENLVDRVLTVNKYHEWVVLKI